MFEKSILKHSSLRVRDSSVKKIRQELEKLLELSHARFITELAVSLSSPTVNFNVYLNALCKTNFTLSPLKKIQNSYAPYYTNVNALLRFILFLLFDIKFVRIWSDS